MTRISVLSPGDTVSPTGGVTHFIIDGDSIDQTKCRHCGDTQCSGRCWGFFGLKRKERLDAKSIHPTDPPRVSNLDNSHSTSFPKRKRPFVVVDHRRDAHIAELVQLNIALSPNEFRDPSSGVRVPHCCTRILRTSTKAKWFGQSVLNVIQSEFIELRRTDVLQNVLAHGLLRLNNKTVPALDVSKLQLTSADTIERIVHWHEAPVIVPARIAVEKVQLPSTVLKEYEIDEEEPVFVYVCNKPSTLPTHPAGPYLSNSLTMMVEGQEGLTPQSLSPLHRTDRVTSGLTLCSTSSAVSRIFQKSLLDGTVEKLYIAKVGGQFPSSLTQANVAESSNTGLNSEYCMWSADGLFLTVDAPIFTADAAAGLRRIDVKLGKPSQSRFRLLHYDPERDSSLVACFPITGRNHQLRVHLQMLGHPILNDVQYGGRRESVYSTGKVTENSVVQAMLDVIKKSNQETDRRVQSLSEDDAAAAKRACPCCRTANEDGIRQSFTPAQLLVEGHAICLHALRYRATFLRSKPKNVPIEGILANGIEASDQLGELDFKVDPPDWASKEALSEIDCIEFH